MACSKFAHAVWALLLWHLCRGNFSTTAPLSLGHLTALTRLHTSGEWSGWAAGIPGVHLFEQDVLPPNLVSLCVGSCEASLTPLLALKSLRKLSLASLSNLPLTASLSPVPQPEIICTVPVLLDFGNLSVMSQNRSVQQTQTANVDNSLRLKLLQKHLPMVEIKVVKACESHMIWKMCCHCCSSQ